MDYRKPDKTDIPQVIEHRYELGRRLREEPWGEVWLARDNFLGTEVALKILLKEAPDWPEAKKILEQEALLALTLRHSQILGVFYMGETERLCYLVQEPFEGETLLAKLARQHRLSLLQSLNLLEQVSEALALAHQQGVAHQSFSPLHILLQGDAARVANFTFPVRDEDQVTHLELKAYHPPEAIQGEGVTPAGNVFSLGVLGFRLVAGSLPYPLTFDEPFPYRLETPPVDLEEIPIALQNVLLRCLAVEPEDRFPDADAFLTQLRQIREPWRSSRPERKAPAAWELENRRSAWQKTASAAELGAKMWAGAKGGAQKVKDLVQTHGPKLRQAPPRLWWGLGLAGLLVILLLAGLKISKEPPPPQVAVAPPSPAAAPAVKVPGIGGGPPLVEAQGPVPKSEPPPRGEVAATEAPPAAAAPAPAPEAKVREERYLILVATYAKEEQARTLSRRLRANNYKAQVVKKSAAGKVKYQVQIGPVTGVKQAEEMARKIKAQEKLTPKIQKIPGRSAASPQPPRKAAR
jgi:cell division septation protein DedD